MRSRFTAVRDGPALASAGLCMFTLGTYKSIRLLHNNTQCIPAQVGKRFQPIPAIIIIDNVASALLLHTLSVTNRYMYSLDKNEKIICRS